MSVSLCNLKVIRTRLVQPKLAFMEMHPSIDSNNSEPALGMEPHLKALGIAKLHPEQVQTLESLTKQKDCLVITPTGSGKSLGYITYSKMHDGLVIIVSPLIALIKDQVRAAENFGLNAASLHSNMHDDEKRTNFHLVNEKKTNLLFISPERFNQKKFRDWLLQQDTKLIVIDEAHCVSHWGYGFRPDYRKLGKNLVQFNHTTKLALTATATKESIKDIIWHLGMDSPTIIRKSPIQTDTQIEVKSAVSVQAQESKIIDVVRKNHDLSGVIFCSTVKDTLSVRDLLRKNNVRTILFHGRMTSDEKTKAYQSMRDSQQNVVIATKAFSLGVHFKDLNYVIHKGIPENLESYLQEIGRVGRVTKKIRSSIVYTTRDVAIRKFMNQKSYPEVHTVISCIDFFSQNANSQLQVNHDDFNAFAEKTLKIKKKKSAEILDFFQREHLIKLWCDPTGYELIELSEDVEQLEFFLREYKVRKKINLKQFDDVMHFVKAYNPLQNLKEYYDD